MHPSTARRLCCDTGLLLSLHKATKYHEGARVMPNARAGRALNLGRRRRRPSRALLRALWDRDHGCRFPGCERRRYLHTHHIRHWADGGPTDLDNLVLLCGQHHRLLHEGEYSLTLAGDIVTVYDNRGRLVPHAPPLPPVAELDSAPALEPDQEPAAGLIEASATHLPGDPLPVHSLPLDPIDGGQLELDYAVGVVAERWQLRSVG